VGMIFHGNARAVIPLSAWLPENQGAGNEGLSEMQLPGSPVMSATP